MTDHTHDWFVYSTALAEGHLMLRCSTCAAHGYVPDPSRIEWARAFTAPSRPYRWGDAARVKVREERPNPATDTRDFICPHCGLFQKRRWAHASGNVCNRCGKEMD
jgi:hypothetical protein